ncbi:hypothetical protein Acsp04_62160 [Actinomadura sp. NBRC 104425]|nr:hypothetical protein Acsp04_62160 [Actinomadura sp. NBRC 104425]
MDAAGSLQVGAVVPDGVPEAHPDVGPGAAPDGPLSCGLGLLLREDDAGGGVLLPGREHRFHA